MLQIDIDQDGVVSEAEVIRFVRVTSPGRFPPHGTRRDMPAELQKLCGATTMEFIHSIGSAYYAQEPLKVPTPNPNEY